jgi:O-antigen ligase
MRKISYREILNKLNVFSLLGIAFLIPFNSHLNRYLLGIFMVSTLILYFNSLGSLKLVKCKGLIALFLFLIFYGLSFIYSHNLKLAWIDFEKKLPLILLPLALVVISPGENKTSQLFRAFLTGVWVVTAVCAVFFIYRTFSDAHFQRVLVNHPFYQIYSKFYFFGNTNYYAVYLIMAMIPLMGMLWRNVSSVKERRMKWFIYLSLALFIILSLAISSRSGIVSLAVVLIFSVYYLVKNRYFRLVSLGLLIVLGLYITTNYRFSNYIRVLGTMLYSPQKLSDNELLENSALRLIFWKASADIISENVWFGVGSGDVKSQMKSKYKEMGVYEQLHENDDPHNQFLRTWVATGLPGFLALMGVFVFAFTGGIQRRNYLLLAFLILMLIHFLFKSMLFREDGVVFFSFFYGLLYVTVFPETRKL